MHAMTQEEENATLGAQVHVHAEGGRGNPFEGCHDEAAAFTGWQPGLPGIAIPGCRMTEESCGNNAGYQTK